MSPAAALVGLLGIFAAALFMAARAALLAADQEELATHHREGKAWASRVKALLDRPERLFVDTRLGVELAFLAGAMMILDSAAHSWSWAAVALGGFVWAFVFLGEWVPQAVVARRPSPWIPSMTWVLVLGHWILYPWSWIARLAHAIGHGSPVEENQSDSSHITRQELAWLIRGNGEMNDLPREERKMIDRIFRFSNTQVREVMIPLIDVQAVEEGTEVGDVIRAVVAEGYSRLPVFRDRIDQILGIVRCFDLLDVPDPAVPVASFVRKAPYVPETMPVDELMLQFQREGHHMAIVVDEYGGSVGIVTMEDVLEEIVGEIEDEYDVQEVRFRKLSPHQVLVDARTEIDELNERLGLQLPKDEYETVGGFLLKSFRRIPAEGESLIFREVRFTVQKASERSVEEVVIHLPKTEGT